MDTTIQLINRALQHRKMQCFVFVFSLNSTDVNDRQWLINILQPDLPIWKLDGFTIGCDTHVDPFTVLRLVIWCVYTQSLLLIADNSNVCTGESYPVPLIYCAKIFKDTRNSIMLCYALTVISP